MALDRATAIVRCEQLATDRTWTRRQAIDLGIAERHGFAVVDAGTPSIGYDRHVLASVNWRGDAYLAATRVRERSIAIGKKVVPEQYVAQFERLATHLNLLS